MSDLADSTARATVKDLQRRWGEVADRALVEPVVITSHGRARHVLLGVAEYQKLLLEARRASLVRDLPEPLMAVLEEGLGELRAAGDAPEGEDTIG